MYGCSSSENTSATQNYSIIKDETKSNNAKRVVEIELPSIISQEKLEEIADSIKTLLIMMLKTSLLYSELRIVLVQDIGQWLNTLLKSQ